jgi:hypothetical protein
MPIDIRARTVPPLVVPAATRVGALLARQQPSVLDLGLIADEEMPRFSEATRARFG